MLRAFLATSTDSSGADNSDAGNTDHRNRRKFHRAVVIARTIVVAVARPIVIGSGRRDRASSQRARHQTEGQSGADAPRLGRRGHRGCRNRGNRRHDC